MNTTSRQAHIWAFLTLTFGLLVAFPFFKRAKSDPPQNSNKSLALPISTNRLVAGILPATRSSTQERRELEELARSQLQSHPTAARLPTWAKPKSALDQLIQRGANSLASNEPKRFLETLPIVTDVDLREKELAQEAIESSHATSSLAGITGSPWENKQQSHYVARGVSIEHAGQPTWRDDHFAARARQLADSRDINSQAGTVANFMRYPAEVGIRTVGVSSQSEFQADRSLRTQPAEDKRRRFVYQPGLQIADE